MIKNVEEVSWFGLTEESMMENGKMDNSTEKVSIIILMVKEEKEFGRMVEYMNGIIEIIKVNK